MESNSYLIQVVQLPIIANSLKSKKAEIEQRVADAMSLVCTNGTIQTVKSVRADLNKEFAEMEAMRKAVKQAVMKPYNDFEDGEYKEVADLYKSADACLKSKIEDVESLLKQSCEEGLRDYFAELVAVHHLGWLKYEQAGIKIDMASAKSKNSGRLKKQLAEFVVKVNEDVNLIADMPNAEEIMVEFRDSLDATKAIQTVLERNRRKADELISLQERTAHKAFDGRVEAKVEEAEKEFLPLPTVEVKEAEEEDVKCVFTVRTTMWKLRKLKEFMNEEGIKYE